jgi:hypothetical protein
VASFSPFRGHGHRARESVQTSITRHPHRHLDGDVPARVFADLAPVAHATGPRNSHGANFPSAAARRLEGTPRRPVRRSVLGGEVYDADV